MRLLDLRARQRVVRAMPRRSQILLYVVVFCTAASLGLLPEILDLGAVPIPFVFLYAGVWGTVGALIVFLNLQATRVFRLIAVVAMAAAALLSWTVTFPLPKSLDAQGVAAARTNLTAIVWVTMGAIMVAYRAVFSLVTREGQRYWGALAEIQLARGIHQALVPAVAGRCASLDWRGVSRPSGEVGGDLVDVIDRPSAHPGWIGCVADVSGHGVGAGLLMGMFKTALHGAVDDAPDAGALMTRVNTVLDPLSEPNMFVTAVALCRRDGRTFEYVLAGHPPLLCWRAHDRRAEWVGEPQLALCLASDTHYDVRILDVASGDLVIAVTDGLLEVFDGSDRELGRVGVAQALDAIDETTSLADIEQRLFEACRRHGRQTDDQTVLMVRVG